MLNSTLLPVLVAVSFALGGALRRVHENAIRLYSEHIFSELTGGPVTEWAQEYQCAFEYLLNEKDWEDLVAMYLQASRSYLLIPSTCRVGTPKYEFVLMDPASGEDVVVQVKSGRKQSLVPTDYSQSGTKVVLFARSGSYPGSCADNVECIELNTILDFVRASHDALPKRMRLMLRFTTPHHRQRAKRTA